MSYQNPGPSALLSMPSSAQLGGDPNLGPAFVRFPFFPTSPWVSTNPSVGYQVRYYSTRLMSTDPDYVVNSEAQRLVQFDIPVRLVAINGAAIVSSDPTLLTEQNMNLTYGFRLEYTTGDKLHTNSRIASTVVGTMKNPGEIGSHGYNIDQGASVVIGLTPYRADLMIDITLVCLEMRGPRNFSVG
jgi:hypothetical protein